MKNKEKAKVGDWITITKPEYTSWQGTFQVIEWERSIDTRLVIILHPKMGPGAFYPKDYRIEKGYGTKLWKVLE